MNQIAIMTDSTCGLPSHVVEREGVIVIPCQVRIGDQIYKEGVDLTTDALFEHIFSSTEVPATSLPAGEDYTAAFEEAQRRGATQVLGIFVGSGYSGTFNGARLAAQEHPELDTELIDSSTTAIAQGLLVLEAVKQVRAGQSLQQAVEAVRMLVERTELYALLDTLEFVRRGGRIGRVGELIANVLNIKPILRVSHNAADVVARNRSRKKGINWLLETAGEAAPLRAAGVMHINAAQEAAEVAKALESLVEEKQAIMVTDAPSAIATHAGPNALGIGFIR